MERHNYRFELEEGGVNANRRGHDIWSFAIFRCRVAFSLQPSSRSTKTKNIRRDAQAGRNDTEEILLHRDRSQPTEAIRTKTASWARMLVAQEAQSQNDHRKNADQKRGCMKTQTQKQTQRQTHSFSHQSSHRVSTHHAPFRRTRYIYISRNRWGRQTTMQAPHSRTIQLRTYHDDHVTINHATSRPASG